MRLLKFFGKRCKRLLRLQNSAVWLAKRYTREAIRKIVSYTRVCENSVVDTNLSPPTGFLSVTVMVSAEFVELRLERWQRAVVVRRVAWPSGVRDNQRMS